MGRRVSDGRSVRVTVPESTVVNKGDLVLLDGFFGLAAQAATTGAGESTEIVLDCEEGIEIETSQITAADAFAKGAAVYWDAATKLLTTAANPDASGNPQNRPVGRVTVAKDANGVIWFKLGPQVQAH